MRSSLQNISYTHLEQIYSPAIELTSLLTVSVSLYEVKLLPVPQIGNKLRDVTTLNNVNRDLPDEPFPFELNLSEFKDGLIAIRADVRDVNRSLGTVNLIVDIRRGLNERLRKLEADWARVKGFDSLRAEMFYPSDYIRNANRGRFMIWGFDVGLELAITEKVLWAALGPIAGRGMPEWLQQIKHIPVFVVHGDADPTASVELSRTMVAEMKRLGMEYRYIEVSGGNHANVAEPNFRAMFDFFDKHRKAPIK